MVNPLQEKNVSCSGTNKSHWPIAEMPLVIFCYIRDIIAIIIVNKKNHTFIEQLPEKFISDDKFCK